MNSVYNEDYLLPCPFCGKEAKWNIGGFGELFPSCSDDNCLAFFGSGIWTTKEHTKPLALKWNTRAKYKGDKKWMEENNPEHAKTISNHWKIFKEDPDHWMADDASSAILEAVWEHFHGKETES